MSWFRKKKIASNLTNVDNSAAQAQLALNFIAEGVLLVDERGVIQFANPAAAEMTGYGTANNIVGLGLQSVLRLEDANETPVDPAKNPLYIALAANQSLTTRDYLLVSTPAVQSTQATTHRIAIALTCIPTGGAHEDRIVTFRDITKELAEENEQTEFISTASHEMRTPVASIEGYLGLALNPQTATIDARARQYLEAAHSSSQHLGRLFKDLLDVTKLEDNRLKPHLVPVDAVEVVRKIADERENDVRAKHLRYSFGTAEGAGDKKRVEPKVYMATDVDFLREIMDNLIENAIKYTPEGGEVWVNARGDGDKVLINVTDTGIGVSNEDAGHVFQKFYRVDNSQTRQIGGTGLGLYLVKQRVEALGGRVWVESSFGDGSTFYVSLPRISDSEYEKMRIAQANEQMVQSFAMKPAGVAPQVQPVAAQATTPAQAAVQGQVAQVATAPVVQTAQPTAMTQAAATGQTTQASQPVQPVVAQPGAVAGTSVAGVASVGVPGNTAVPANAVVPGSTAVLENAGVSSQMINNPEKELS